jgi:hypothetical protein
MEATKTSAQQSAVATEPDPSKIMQIGTGFWASKVLLAAVKFDLFTTLATGPKTGLQIKQQLNFKCIDRHVYDWLDTLTSFGFLNREGLLENAVYSNGADTGQFLDKNKPSYIGGMLLMLNNRLYKFWGNLEDGLLTGQPQNEGKEGGDLFKAIYASEEKLREFTNAMSGIQAGNFLAFAQKFDFSKYKTLVDAGGSGGFLSIFVAQANQHLQCTSLDLPPLEPIANENIAKFGLADRVKAASGDFFQDAIPAADVVVMGNILHDWSEDQKNILVKKAFDALPVGGAFVAIEGIIDEQRKENVFGLMMSLNMLIETGAGFDYTFSDFNRWTIKAGFQRTELIPLAGPFSAAIAYK